MTEKADHAMGRSALCLGLLMFSASLLASEWSLQRQTIAPGGTEQSASADSLWDLAATLGQWEATGYAALTDGEWELSGGFWAARSASDEDSPEEIFSDRFES